jgi:hypothetical protein
MLSLSHQGFLLPQLVAAPLLDLALKRGAMSLSVASILTI